MLRGGRRFLTLALPVCLLAVPRQAVAQLPPDPPPTRVSLHWEDLSSPACLSTAQLEAAVDALLSRTAFGQEPADAVVHGTLTRNADGTRTARIELRRPDGTSLGIRELHTADTSCRALREGVPIALSLMIDTRRREVLLQLPKTVAAPEAPPPAPSPQSPPPTPLPAAPSKAASWRSELDAAASLDWGLLPGTTLATRMGAGWRHANGWALRAQAGLVAPHTTHYDGGGVTAWAWQAGAGGGLQLVEDRWIRADLVYLIESGQMLSRGTGFELQKTARSWLLEALAGARGTVRLGTNWSIGLAGWGGVPLIRQRITYREPGGMAVLTRSSPVFARGELFVGLGAW